MSRYALIIGVEHYPGITGPNRVLKGTAKGALAMLERFQRLGVPRENAFVHLGVEGEQPQGTLPATREAILQSLDRLHEQGRDRTERLYFFFSGHGLSYGSEQDVPVDLITTSEFVSAKNLNPTLRVDELLRIFLGLGGGGHLFLFIDACRLPASVSPMSGGQTGLNLEPSKTGRPTYYLLQSTVAWDVASTGGALGSPFTTALVDALSGVGKAKAWLGPKLVISFDSVCDFVQARLEGRQTLDPTKRGRGDGVLQELKDYKCRCIVHVKHTGQGDVEVLISSPQSNAPLRQRLRAGENQLELVPNSYTFQLGSAMSLGTFTPPSPVEIFEPMEIELVVRPLELHLLSYNAPRIDRVAMEGYLKLLNSPRTGKLEFEAPSQGSARLIAVGTGQQIDAAHKEELSPGHYRMQLELDGRVVQARRFEIKPGQTTRVDLSPEEPQTPAAQQLLAAIPGAHEKGRADFSERLGFLVGETFSTWLTVAAGGLIVRPRGYHHKLAQLHFLSFETLDTSQAALYVVTVGDSRAPSVEVQTLSGEGATAKEAAPVPSLSQVWHCGIEGVMPDSVVRITRAEGGRLSLAPPFLPGQVTLVIVDGTSLKKMDVLCLVLPTSQLPDELVAKTHPMLCTEDERLRGVLKLARAEHDFVAWREEPLKQLLARPVDPVIGPMLSHFQIALGDLEGARRTVQALEEVFGEMRDIVALKHFLGLPIQAKPSLSLWLDGVLALEPEADVSRLAPVLKDAKLMLQGPWALWVG